MYPPKIYLSEDTKLCYATVSEPIKVIQKTKEFFYILLVFSYQLHNLNNQMRFEKNVFLKITGASIYLNVEGSLAFI